MVQVKTGPTSPTQHTHTHTHISISRPVESTIWRVPSAPQLQAVSWLSGSTLLKLLEVVQVWGAGGCSPVAWPPTAAG